MKYCVIICLVTIALTSAQQCGKLQFSVEDNNKDLPWTVKLRERKSNDVLCTGTLISDRHALFAAHCLWPKPYFNSLKDNANVYVTIKNANSELVQIKIHPDWKFNKGNYDADVAIVTLFGKVDVTETVQPICLPTQNDGNLIANDGVVAGTNKVDNQNVRQKVSLERNDDCFKDFPPSANQVSPRTFCAKWKSENLELVNGFSGSYFYPVGSSWFIQGMESESFVQKQDCNVNKHSIFTNIAHYVDWIQKIVRKDTETQYKDIELQCNFVKNYEGLYGCEVENLVIDSPNVRIASIAGQSSGQQNTEVLYVWIKNSRAPYLPRFEAGIFFPNLVKYLVTDSGVKFINRDNFSGIRKLQTLDLSGNEIEDIPEDTLEENEELVDFFINNNNLKKLPENLLHHAPLFQRLMASNNSLEVLDAGLFRDTPHLKILTLDNNKLQKIYPDFTPLGNLKKIDLTNNRCLSSSYNDWRHLKSVAIIQREIDASCK